MNTRSLTESLYNKYGKYLTESVNSKKINTRKRSLKEGLFDDESINNLIKKYSFRIIDKDEYVLHVQKDVDFHLSGNVYVELNEDESFKTIEVDFYFDGNEFGTTKYFDDFSTAISYCDQTLSSMEQAFSEIINVDYELEIDAEDLDGEIETARNMYNVKINPTYIDDDEHEVTLEGKAGDILYYIVDNYYVNAEEAVIEYPEFQMVDKFFK